MAYFDLGRPTRLISTRTTEAQRWFDLGLNWSFGFNHEACSTRSAAVREKSTN
jgi:hypothetical protein